MTILQEINSFFQTMIKTEFIELSDQLLLTNEDQTIFRLRYVDKMSAIDIAYAINKKESYVNRKLFIIRQKLSKLPIFTKEKFNPDTASEYAMREKCRKCGFSAFMTNFCVDAFCIRLSNKELANKYNYSLATVKQYKTEKRKQLSK